LTEEEVLADDDIWAVSDSDNEDNQTYNRKG